MVLYSFWKVSCNFYLILNLWGKSSLVVKKLLKNFFLVKLAYKIPLDLWCPHPPHYCNSTLEKKVNGPKWVWRLVQFQRQKIVPAVRVKQSFPGLEDGGAGGRGGGRTESSSREDRSTQQQGGGCLLPPFAFCLMLFLLLRDSHPIPVGFLYYWQGPILGFSLSINAS